MGDQQHMIGRMSVVINAPRPGQAARLQEQLGYRLHTQGFLQQLESLLDTLVRADEYLEIPSLSISLDCRDEADFHATLLKKLSAAISEQLTQKPADNILLQNETVYTTAVRTFFLKYGIRAFYNGRDMLSVLQTEIKSLPQQSQPALEQLLKQIGKEHPPVWTRLYYLLGAAGIQSFFLRTFALTPETLQAMISEQLTLAPQQPAGRMLPAASVAGMTPAGITVIPAAVLQDARLWQTLFLRVLNNESIVTSKLVAAHGVTTNKNSTPARTATTQNGADQQTPVTAEHRSAVTDIPLKKQLQQGVLVDNAGLVLLWADCGRLFRALGYVIDKKFVDETAQQRAILLLHYIVWGVTDGSEDTWLLNKLLCGWSPETPVDPAFVPDETAMQAADEMLLAYLEAWRKDRKFSADWLRRSFLQREGQLFARIDENWMLEVNSRTEDILIKKVSMVRYAWMPHILFVRW